ncbi:MAG: FKBP-type peptidyl-prolyl cis-trans isomerase [Phycisphaerae bacterium]
MAPAKDGDKVKVQYTGKLKEDGQVFDSNDESNPLEFTVGQGQIIPGFEQAVVGMEEGEEKTVDVPADQGYGRHTEERVVTVHREQLPEDLDPQVGQRLEVRQGEQSIPVVVTDVNEQQVTLDANHPLAGKDLQFDIKVLEIG